MWQKEVRSAFVCVCLPWRASECHARAFKLNLVEEQQEKIPSVKNVAALPYNSHHIRTHVGVDVSNGSECEATIDY